MTDLTERLAAKLPHELRAERLSEWGNFIPEFAIEVSTWADQILEFLLSEPELVAGLPEAVKYGLLRQLREWQNDKHARALTTEGKE